MSNLRIYLAGGITGLTHDEAFSWRKEVTQRLEPLGIKCYNPLKSDDLEKYSSDGNTFTSGDKICYLRDRFMVRKSDIVLINLDTFIAGGSWGTLVEKGWADLNMNQLIIVVSKEGAIHCFVAENAIIVKTMDEALELIKELN